MAKSKTALAAEQIRKDAERAGFRISADLSYDFNPQTREWDGRVIDATVTVETAFTPGDAKAYVVAEYNATVLLREFRMIRPGSTWGTDSASVGGHAGLTGGYMRLSKSGVEIRLARQFT
jgi:hypothetical protein